MEIQESKKYGKMLEIDPLKLDDEWTFQAGLFMFWAEKAANARAKADKARFGFEKIEAQLSSDVRTNPGNYGLEKVTETSIANAVKQSEEYENAYLARIEANKVSDILAKVVVALEHRKKALENLAYLHSAGFNSEPNNRRKQRGVK